MRHHVTSRVGLCTRVRDVFMAQPRTRSSVATINPHCMVKSAVNEPMLSPYYLRAMVLVALCAQCGYWPCSVVHKCINKCHRQGILTFYSYIDNARLV